MRDYEKEYRQTRGWWYNRIILDWIEPQAAWTKWAELPLPILVAIILMIELAARFAFYLDSLVPSALRWLFAK